VFPNVSHLVFFPRKINVAPTDEAALLLGPSAVVREIPTKVLGALATRFNTGNQKRILTEKILKDAICIEWSKIRRVDSDAGDTMAALELPSTALTNQQDIRDRTFVRVSGGCFV
jgi:hypothetical protein